MRENPSDKSEMVNQILFGEIYEILRADIKFSLVKLNHDGYEGWICNKQVTNIEEQEFINLKNEISSVTTDIIDIVDGDEKFPILMGSILPSLKSNHCFINNQAYEFSGNYTQGFSDIKMVTKNAYSFLNAPYLWGGRTVFGIDCSGFTQIIYRMNGIKIHRDAKDQIKNGRFIDNFSDAKAGDLAFFVNENGLVTHVGIMLSNSKIIHSSGKVRIDSIDENGIYDTKKGTYTHKFKKLKRIIEN